jgi:prepilin-type N-terminal cleavage/methylation domain-containing protein
MFNIGKNIAYLLYKSKHYGILYLTEFNYSHNNKHFMNSHMDTHRYRRGFTVIEVLVVIVIIGILSSIVLGSVREARDKAYYVRAQKELTSVHESLQLYLADNNFVYPPDVSRGLPSGLETYLSSGRWPAAPWPNTVYDWDVWDDPSSSTDIIQISVRFCPVGGALETCNFPIADWAENFGVNSSVYYCIQGACRAHIAAPITYPGKCVNCAGTSTSL